MSDEHLYFKMEEMSDEMMVIDATGLGSELEIATEFEEPPLTMQLSNLPIRYGLDICHDGGGNETSDDDSLESYLQSPNPTYDDGLDSRHDEGGSSSDGSVEYPSFSMQSSHLSFKNRLENTREEHGCGMSEDSTESPPLSTKSSDLSDEGKMDIMHDKGEKTISDNCGVSCRPFIVKLPSLSFKNTIDNTHDKNDCTNTTNTSLNNLPPNNAEITYPAKDVLHHKQDKGVVGTSGSDSAEFSFSSNISSLPVKDGLRIIHEGNNVHIGTEQDNIKYSPLSTKLPIAYNDNLSSVHEGGGEAISDNSTLEHKPLKSSPLSNDNEIEPKYEEGSKSAFDNMNINAKDLLKSIKSNIEKTLKYRQNKTDDKVSENCKLELSPLKKKSSLPTENKQDILHDEDSRILHDKNLKLATVSRLSPSLCTENELNSAHGQQSKICITASIEPAPFKIKSCIMPNENLSLYEKSGISTSDTIHSTTSDYDSVHTSPLSIKPTNLTSIDILGCELSTEENRSLEDNHIELCNLPSENRLNIKSDTDDSGTLGDNTLDLPSAIKSSSEPIKEKQKDSIEERILDNDHLEFSCSLLSENKLNDIYSKDNNEILSGNTAEFSYKSSSMTIEETLDASFNKSDKISNDSVESLPFTSDISSLINDDKLKIRNTNDDNTSSNDDIVETQLHATKLLNEGEKDIKAHDRNSINSGEENSDLSPLTLNDDKLKIRHSKDDNASSNDGILESQLHVTKLLNEGEKDIKGHDRNSINFDKENSDLPPLILNDDKLKFSNSKDDNTSSCGGILETQLHATKLLNEGEKDVKVHDRDSINSDEENADSPPLIMKSSNVSIDNELDFMHDGGGNESSDEENVEPPKKKLKVMDSSNIRSSKKVHFDSDNSASYDGFNCQFSSEEKMKQCSEMDYDSIADNLNSNHTGMMEFDILDEFESNDNDNDNDDRYSDCESDISLDELDAMLEAGFQNPTNANKEDRSRDEGIEHEEKEKVILKVRGKDHFDVLPEGWVEVTHNSGIPIYLHRASRVCCASKPYFLGPGSTRKHEIPVSAIPCLNYLRELEKEKNQDQEAEEKSNGEKFPPAKLECVKETKESGSLDYLAVREYCKKRFEFQTITVKRFRTWAGRRRHQKQMRLKQRPSLPDNTKLITCPLPPASDKTNTTGGITKKEFIMNPSGKSPVCILHEYVQHTLRVQPRYIYKELENASTPYGAVVEIGGIEYGSGYGSSKKQAKSEAAKAALDVLIPKMKMFPPDDPLADIQEDVEFFDQVRVEDPRVSELSIKAGQPYPFQILLECLKRNYGMGDTEIDITMRNLKHQKNEFIMKVGKHSVSVICKNKRDGKHRASQAILQLLHPHITTWGSLLRMYGKGSCKTLKEKKEEEQRITELQSQACANKPNLSILRKLKEEMLKYREKMKMKKPIGKLIPEHLELSTSDSNLKNVEL